MAVDEVPETDIWLRLEPTRNGQQSKIRWAKDYLLETRVAALVTCRGGHSGDHEPRLAAR